MKKRITCSVLFLVAFPLSAFAQQSNSQVQPDSYFAEVPIQVQSGKANHITGAQLDSQRESATARELRLEKATNALLSAQLSAAQAIQNIRTLQQSEAFQAPRVSQLVGNTQNQVQITNEVVQPPNVAPQDFAIPNTVNKPTPATVQPPAVPARVEVAPPAMNIREVEYAQATDDVVTSQYDPTSIDSYRMTQQSEPWAEKSNTMRHIGDHFSPGGKPFAYQTSFPNSNFFGVDRNQCCDEWAGHCNCSGGLKTNPGHLGIPWLRGKEPCDSAVKLGRKRQGCGCAACCE